MMERVSHLAIILQLTLLCSSLRGYSTQESDVCTSVLPICKNGGTCLEQGNGLPTCACPSGYIGARCQLQDAELCMLLQPHFCMNGGSCIVKDTAEGREVACDCAEGFSGLRCGEEANTVTYLPTTGLEFEEATVNEIDTTLSLTTGIEDLLKTQLILSTAELEISDFSKVMTSTITPAATSRQIPTTRTTKSLIATASPHVYEEELKNITSDLTKENATIEEVGEAAETVLEIAKNDTFLSEKPERVGLVIESLESIVDTGYTTKNITEPVVDIINNLLDLDEGVIAEGTSEGGRAVAALEKLVENIQEEEGNVTIVRENIGVTAVKVEEGNLDGNLVFAVVDQESSPDGNEHVGDRSLTTELYDDEDQLGPVAEPTTVIAIPREVIESFGEEDNSTAVPISFIVYKNDLLFTPSMPSKNFSEEEEEDITEMIASHVISARIKNKDGERHLEPPIVAKFRLDVVLNATSTKHCVIWNYDDKTRQGSWTEDGCQMMKDEANYTVCECTRFASFAILVRVDNGDIVLYYITVVGSIISAICLILCLITFVSLKSLRSKQPTHIHINLCASLLGFYISFMLGIPAARDTGLCRAASAATHFFSLATIAWMTAEAVNMYFLFVKLERRGIKYFIPIASLLTYGLSAVCVVLTIFLDKKTQFERASYCFIQPGNALYFGFLIEVAALFAFNFFIFMWVIRKMLCRPLMVSNTRANHRRKEILTRVRHGILFWFVLGLSWFFGFLSAITVDSTTFVFDYLYCVFTALQGFMMFLLLCVANPEFRKIFQRFSMRGDLTQTDSSNLTAQRSTIIKRRTSGNTIKSISSGNSESQA